MENTDIILTDGDEVAIFNDDLVVGASLWQEVKNIIRLIPGQLKYSPMLGPNLVRMINSKISDEQIKNAIKRNLEADGKDYDEIKNGIRLKTR